MSLNVGSSGTQKARDDVMRQNLLQCLQQEQEKFAVLSERYYAIEERDDAQDVFYTQEVIQLVDRLLAAGDWESSLFLRNTIRPFRNMREEAVTLLAKIQGEVEEAEQAIQYDGDGRTVFVSIFQAQGHDLKKWEMLLRSIDRYLLGRPVYQQEEDVKKLIRLKTNKVSEAYIKVVVSQQAIQTDMLGMQRTDRHGSPLLILAPNAIKASQIQGFYHQGKAYQFYDGRLKEVT